MSVAKFSASKLKTYKLCPRQYHYIYDLGLIQRASDAMILGTRYHALLRKFYNNEFIEELPDKDVVLKGLMEKNKLNPINGLILDTEKWFEIIVDDIIIRGVFDRLDEDRTVEYKSSSFDYKPCDVDNFQTDIYILARYMTMGDLVPLDYHVNNKKKIKTKKYLPQIIRVERSLEDLEGMKKNIVDTIHKIMEKEFEPTPGPQCWYCPFGPSSYIGTNNCNAYDSLPKKVCETQLQVSGSIIEK